MKRVLSNAALGTALTLVLLAYLLAYHLTGCSPDSAIYAPDPEIRSYPFPDSPNQLMANFAAAYGARDLEGYAGTLHRDFTYVLHPAAVGPGEPETWGRDEELRISANMFSGEDRVKNGVTVTGVARIEIRACAGKGPWVAAGATAEGRAILRRAYEVDVLFVREGDTDLSVRGTCIFDVTGVPGEFSDSPDLLRWEIIRWVDRTGG